MEITHIHICSTFRAMIDQAGLDEILRDPSSNLTIFAPQNTAFDVIDSNILERLIHSSYKLELVRKTNRNGPPRAIPKRGDTSMY